MTSQLDRIEAKLDRLNASLDRAQPWIETLPGMFATMGNTVDALAASDGPARLDERVRRTVAVLLEASDPTVLNALELLAGAAAELPRAAEAPREHLGLFGLYRVLREDEVQRALGVLVHFTRRLGRMLEDQERK